ncbi:MAG: bifunctional tRNA (5-methylaminomethyl-2-thiouridine)(34)-methyltransferase MnmD/FAD-dependent 5-carboxymethylaminomethyl-2-thiouridine(34) oxidoreductase MnmC [Pseudomonadota bacterium]|nr:bifunctional tRNA (5-methylaminomethyl-2-thiouridine)(34)-methyltransferase MnmD/FAD-dependent 5-carboxymethylaminomethyl-2-thiouridine(34) oxidoreductase MnmC [Pseudomonadota bacterium]MED5423067.1 bifunctional tRNA (5-methylaminomethyl-2-thiouridine)(34)-methyltransferase MnmD/FAD-dependent 5-carboxymethylaminomethyl-2-thiouridine(34) oxidoreductase MnmC [Pseudomonadota bacterium]
MTIRSEEFDDIYFSPEDGVAETEYVFLRGNNLPQNWLDKDHFTIAETGFGTGLNFFVAWDMFEQTASPQQSLHFVSFEKFPLTPAVIKDALSPWGERFGDKIDALIKHYPLRIKGWHHLNITPQITLTLIFDDINNAIPELNLPIDAWFLDGFAPSKNPQMWDEPLFSAMRRCAHSKTTAATFTAAGFVKRGMRDAGFNVKKDKGFGRKRDMLVATFSEEETAPHTPITKAPPQNIAIIGGGLGGTAAAYFLAQAGHKITLFEKENSLAAKASGNARGLYNPRFRKQYDTESIFYSSAYATAYRTFKNLNADIDFTPCGAMHLLNNEQKQDRLPATKENWGWHDDHMRLISTADSEACCGIDLPHDALYLADSGFVSPHKLCHAFSANINIKLGIDNIDYAAFDAVILATGADFADFPELEPLNLHTVRGQITSLKAPDNVALNTVLCYGGYTTPANDGEIICGSSFQRWRDDTDLDPQDNIDNLAMLNAVLPKDQHIDQSQITGARTALRTAARDHFPIIGHLRDNLYVSTAHGSHGLLSSIMGGIILSEIISYNGASALPQNVLKKLSPQRFTHTK